MKPKTKLAADAWLTAIEDLRRADDAKGETAETLAKAWGVGREHTRIVLSRLVAAGKAEHVGFQKRGNSRLKVYRLIEGAKEKAKR